MFEYDSCIFWHVSEHASVYIIVAKRIYTDSILPNLNKADNISNTLLNVRFKYSNNCIIIIKFKYEFEYIY